MDRIEMISADCIELTGQASDGAFDPNITNADVLRSYLGLLIFGDEYDE